MKSTQLQLVNPHSALFSNCVPDIALLIACDDCVQQRRVTDVGHSSRLGEDVVQRLP